MSEEKNVLILTQSVSKFFMKMQIAALHSFPETDERTYLCIYILKDMNKSLYKLIINYGDKWNWSDDREFEVISPDYEKLLFHERLVRKIIETVH